MSAELLADMLNAAIGLANIDARFDLIDWSDPDEDEQAARAVIEIARAEVGIERILLTSRERRTFDRAEAALRARLVHPQAMSELVDRVGLGRGGCRRIEAWLTAQIEEPAAIVRQS